MSVICDGCGKTLTKGNFVVFDKNQKEHVICEACIGDAKKALDDAAASKQHKPSLQHNSPEEIYQHISKKVINQVSAKKAVAHAVARHFRKLRSKSQIKKSNVLIYGPTGTGKTYMARAAAEILKVPFCEYSCTDLTPNGYVGDSVSNIFQRLIAAANGDINAAKSGVVFLDEVDKLAKSNVGDKDLGVMTQAALLKVIEGSDIEIKLADQRVVSFNTSNVLFILAGAFVGLTPGVNQVNKVIGIANNIASQTQEKQPVDEEIIATADDLERFGFLPEFIGRISIIGKTNSLNKDDLKKILLESSGSCLEQQRVLFAEDKIGLTFSDEFLDDVIESAMKNNTGARGLEREVERRLMDIFFNLKKYKNKNLLIGKGGSATVIEADDEK